MRKTLKKGGQDFTKRLMDYAIEGGVLARCPDHAGSVYRTDIDVEKAYAVIEEAWGKGYISSDYESSCRQLDTILAKAPSCCSHSSCWTKRD